MDILVIGSGGREHAIIRKLKESREANKLYCAPGNAGIASDAECLSIDIMNFSAVINIVKEKKIDFVVVAPDNPLAAGMVDALESAGIPTFGPTAKAAEIESSKVFSKRLMQKYHIPTAGFATYTKIDDALAHVRKAFFPLVIKADGLALGKGVVIATTLVEAEAAITGMMLEKQFGDSGDAIVIEEHLTGSEVSVLAFTDGKTMVPMISSKDHKPVFDGDKGPNTGGMGTISPNPYYSAEIASQCMQEIFLPTMHAMNQEERKFKGCLYFGLMLTPTGPKVIEYNARFGDPEAQVVLPLLEGDLLEIMLAVREERLSDVSVRWSEGSCACVVLASGGYPGDYAKGLEITGLSEDGQVEGATVYHSGTILRKDKFLTNGGRVLGITAKGNTQEDAIKNAYRALRKIEFPGMIFRRDIGAV